MAIKSLERVKYARTAFCMKLDSLASDCAVDDSSQNKIINRSLIALIIIKMFEIIIVFGRTISLKKSRIMNYYV